MTTQETIREALDNVTMTDAGFTFQGVLILNFENPEKTEKTVDDSTTDSKMLVWEWETMASTGWQAKK